MTLRRAFAGLCCAAVLGHVAPAQAIRPFVTDDARVVGDKLAQLETWLLVDRLAVEHNLLFALGPTEWLELTLGFIHGGVHSGKERGYSITGPILQAKGLIWPAQDNAWPGLALTAGAFPPAGVGAFAPVGWSGFVYLALTESLWDESLLLHANLGFVSGERARANPPRSERGNLVTGGFGFQARVVAGLHGMGEIYYGDPYDPLFRSPAMQVGFRYIFSEQAQLDGSFGTTLRPVTPLEDAPRQHDLWGTLGLRLVTNALW